MRGSEAPEDVFEEAAFPAEVFLDEGVAWGLGALGLVKGGFAGEENLRLRAGEVGEVGGDVDVWVV